MLRQVLYKYLPKKMVDKPKSGFTIPLDELRPLVEKYISTDKLDSKIFDIDIKEKFYDGIQIWLIMMWKENWLD
nr:asparagine synthase-related protein [Aliarcobacter butzleri]